MVFLFYGSNELSISPNSVTRKDDYSKFKGNHSKVGTTDMKSITKNSG